MNILYLSIFTLRDLIRSKLMWNIPILGGLVGLISFVTSTFTFGSPSKVAVDIGIAGLTLSAYGIAFFAGCTLVKSETDSRTIYVIISRPVNRIQFLLGKISGVVVFLALNILALALITLGTLWALNGELSLAVLVTIGFVFLESILLLVVVVILSMVSNLALTLMFGLLLLIAGHAAGATQDIMWVKQFPLAQGFLKYYHFFLPAFYKLNFKDYSVYAQSFPWASVPSAVAYWACYLLAMIGLGCGIIVEKDFD